MINIHEEIDVRMDDLGQFEELLPLTKFSHKELNAFNFLKSSNELLWLKYVQRNI